MTDPNINNRSGEIGEIEETVISGTNTQIPVGSDIQNNEIEQDKVLSQLADSKKETNGKNTESAVNFFYSKIAHYGEYLCYVIATSVIVPFRIITKAVEFIWKHTYLFRQAFMKMLKALAKFIFAPFLRTRRALKITSSKIKEARSNGDNKTVSRLRFKILKDFIFSKHGIAVTLFNYAAPAIAIAFLVGVINYATATSYAIKLSVNGEFLGYIKSEQVYCDAERIMQERITYAGSASNSTVDISLTPEYSLEQLGSGEYISQYQLANKLMEVSEANIEYAYGFYIGDKFYGALIDRTKVQNELDRILDSYRTDSENEEIQFEKEITYVPGLYLSETLVTPESIIEMINSSKQEATYYTIQDGDSTYAICDKLQITSEELEILNPEITESDYVFRTGNKLLITNSVPFLSVSIARIENYDVSVPYDTEYTTDDEHYQDVFTTVQAGVNGTNNVTARVYYVNGVETKRSVIKTEVVEKPVTEIISEGTLPPQSSHYSSDSVQSGMKYIWPVAGGSFWEWGWWDGGYYGHTGVDIGAPYGTDVYAGASGTVTFAGWDGGGYGYCVIIRHPDGYSTLYAHNSAIYVYAGQSVTQGQCIAAVGETGRAYGCHVHFEVRYGSERLNPRYYLSGLPELYAAGY